LGNLTKEQEKKRNYTAINIIADLKCNEKQQTIMHRLITEFGTTLPTSPGLFSVGEASLFLFERLMAHHYNAEWLPD
jgi:hypothetical protein